MKIIKCIKGAGFKYAISINRNERHKVFVRTPVSGCSEYHIVNKNVKEWLEHNDIEWYEISDTLGDIFRFKNEEDVIAFKMRWE